MTEPDNDPEIIHTINEIKAKGTKTSINKMVIDQIFIKFAKMPVLVIMTLDDEKYFGVAIDFSDDSMVWMAQKISATEEEKILSGKLSPASLYQRDRTLLFVKEKEDVISNAHYLNAKDLNPEWIPEG